MSATVCAHDRYKFNEQHQGMQSLFVLDVKHDLNSFGSIGIRSSSDIGNINNNCNLIIIYWNGRIQFLKPKVRLDPKLANKHLFERTRFLNRVAATNV